MLDNDRNKVCTNHVPWCHVMIFLTECKNRVIDFSVSELCYDICCEVGCDLRNIR